MLPNLCCRGPGGRKATLPGPPQPLLLRRAMPAAAASAASSAAAAASSSSQCRWWGRGLRTTTTTSSSSSPPCPTPAAAWPSQPPAVATVRLRSRRWPSQLLAVAATAAVPEPPDSPAAGPEATTSPQYRQPGAGVAAIGRVAEAALLPSKLSSQAQRLQPAEAELGACGSGAAVPAAASQRWAGAADVKCWAAAVSRCGRGAGSAVGAILRSSVIRSSRSTAGARLGAASAGPRVYNRVRRPSGDAGALALPPPPPPATKA